MIRRRIEIHGGVGELEIKVFKRAQWTMKCKKYFNRYFKTSRVIMVPSDGDMIMSTLSSVCSDSEGRGFVLKITILQSIWSFLVMIKWH